LLPANPRNHSAHCTTSVSPTLRVNPVLVPVTTTL
jgi:hypothetical protein